MAQLYAFDSTNHLVNSQTASKKVDYFCPECKRVVRLRGGIHRQNHFYHLEVTPGCRQSGKSLEHLQTQLYILNALPKDEVQLEYHFPQIQRIADAVWSAQKIIFEVQCSPISLEEIQLRNRDYAKEGYTVVWIMHDKRFNQRRVTAAENYLYPFASYFTNISEIGEGFIYDQYSHIEKGIRKNLKPLKIDLTQPRKRKAVVGPFELKLLDLRNKTNHLYFCGDLLHRSLEPSLDDAAYFQEAKLLEKSARKPSPPFWRQAILWIIRPYRLLLQMLLERACK